MNLLDRIQAAKAALIKAQEELLACRAECSHPFEVLERTRRRTNDEYDATAHYSTRVECRLCGETWEDTD